VVALPLFKLAVISNPSAVTLTTIVGNASTEFKKVLACNPDTVVLGTNSKNPDMGAPEKLSKANM
jgi:hypothetical protein